MKKRLLVIESNTTGTGMIMLKKAKEMGFVPLFITHDPRRYQGLEETKCEVVQVQTNDLAAIEEYINQHVVLDEVAAITTTSDFYLETVARLNERYQLPGNSAQAVVACRNKAKTRQILTEVGLLQPAFMVIESVDQITCAVEKVGLPCVVKPVDDSGSNLVKLCFTQEEIRHQFELIHQETHNVRGQLKDRRALVEEYISAPEYSVEFISRGGELQLIGITQKKVTGEPYFVEAGHVFPAPLAKEQQEEMIQTVTKALRAVGFHYGASHTEVKWTEKGCVVIEINARLAGGMIPELIRLTTDLDLLQVQIETAVGQMNPLDISYNGYASIHFIMAKVPGIFHSIEGMDQLEKQNGVKQWKIYARPGQKVAPPQNAYGRLGHVIVHQSTYEQTVELIDQVESILKVKLQEGGE